MKLPSNYPLTPPSVLLITTGSGTVRFNPNLYNEGKVCLSLLGTWQGEKWDPEFSNINQVIQSICYLIFVENPYFNEPGYERTQGTPSGDLESRKYNSNIRVQTLKYAILDHLINPNIEFGSTILEFLKDSWNNTTSTNNKNNKLVYEKWANEEKEPEKSLILLSIKRIDAFLKEI